MNNLVNHVKDNIIAVTKSNLAIYIAPPQYYIGISALNANEISLKNFISTASFGNSKYIKSLYEQPQVTSVFWDYIVEHRNQFLSKDFMKNNINYLKKFYNKLIFDIHHSPNKIDLRNNNDIVNLFFEYDFCNQVLAVGKYIPNQTNTEFLNLLSDKEILDLIRNHIHIIDEKLYMSTLQEKVQLDVMNNICTHTILEYWKWQGWI